MQSETYRYPRMGIPEPAKKVPEYRYKLHCSTSAKADQRFSPELEDKDERSTSALNEALTPKAEGDEKGTG